MFRCKPFVTNCTTILLLYIIRTFVIFQTSFGVNIRRWLVVMFILRYITTISFNLYFKRVPCTSKNHRQTLTADCVDPLRAVNGGSSIPLWGQAGTSTKFLTSKRRVLVDSELLKETAVNKQCRSALYAMAIYPSVCLSVLLSITC